MRYSCSCSCLGIFSAKRVEEKAVEAETNQTENESGDFGNVQNYLETENYLEEAEMNAAQNNASIGEGNLN